MFSPAAFGARRVDVIGCGAIGSRVVLDLTKLGVENIHAWDFDKVEEHNIANQAFGIGDIGSSKTEALATLVKNATEQTIEIHSERVDGTQMLGDIVFVLTDTMKSRKEIWDCGLKYKLRTKLLVEARMGADSMRIYAVNPNRRGHILEYDKTLYTDEEAEVSACGASITVGPTAEIAAGLATWQMVRWFAIEQGGEDELDNEIILGLRSMLVMTRKFK